CVPAAFGPESASYFTGTVDPVPVFIDALGLVVDPKTGRRRTVRPHARPEAADMQGVNFC
ncbi:unnamed protein product, partial [marine sediment metagenome]